MKSFLFLKSNNSSNNNSLLIFFVKTFTCSFSAFQPSADAAEILFDVVDGCLLIVYTHFWFRVMIGCVLSKAKNMSPVKPHSSDCKAKSVRANAFTQPVGRPEIYSSSLILKLRS